MTSAARREHRPASERRTQLLDAASAVMREGGVAAATTRAVTARAGLPNGAFHYCFASKSELFAALLGRELTGSLLKAWEAVADTEDLEAGLAAGLGAYLDHVRADPAHQMLMVELTVTAARATDLAHVPAWEHRQYVQRVAELLTAWADGREAAWSAPVTDLAEALVSAASGLALSWLSSRDDAAAAAAARALAAALAGLATRA
jgi:AcrR family transcriptional regulator